MADQLFYEMRGSEQRGKTLGITQRSTPLEQPWTGEMRVRYGEPSRASKMSLCS